MASPAPTKLPVPTQLPSSTQQTGDRQTLAIQARLKNVERVVNQLGAPSIVTAATKFTAGQKVSFNHGLSRVPTIWEVVDVVGGYGAFQRISWDNLTIVIQSQNACTAQFRIQ